MPWEITKTFNKRISAEDLHSIGYVMVCNREVPSAANPLKRFTPVMIFTKKSSTFYNDKG